MTKAYILQVEAQTPHPLAVYCSRAEAEAEAERLQAEYKRTNPAFTAWCNERWRIVEEMRAAGVLTYDSNPPTALPTDEQEKEIIAKLGICPNLQGYEYCGVVEVEDRR